MQIKRLPTPTGYNEVMFKLNKTLKFDKNGFWFFVIPQKKKIILFVDETIKPYLRFI